MRQVEGLETLRSQTFPGHSMACVGQGPNSLCCTHMSPQIARSTKAVEGTFERFKRGWPGERTASDFVGNWKGYGTFLLAASPLDCALRDFVGLNPKFCHSGQSELLIKLP